MERSTLKAEMMVKPVLLKAGIPLALSMAAFLFSKIMAKKGASRATLSENEANLLKEINRFGEERSFRRLSLVSIDQMEEEEEEERLSTNASFVDTMEIAEIHENHRTEEEILGLRRRVEDFQNLKKEDSLLIDLRNLSILELAHMRFMDREISYMEENKRVENLAMEYLQIMEQFQNQKSKNKLLERQIKEISSKSEMKSRVIRERNLKIEEREAEIYRQSDEIENKDIFIKKIEDEVRELQISLNHLEQEKIELLKKIEMVALASNTKIKAEMVTMEDFVELVRELEELNIIEIAEVNEILVLKWKNARLAPEDEKRERTQERKDVDLELKGNEGKENGEMDCKTLEKNERSLRYTRGQKLIKRLRKWAEGSENMKGKSRGKEKCFGIYDARTSKA